MYMTCGVTRQPRLAGCATQVLLNSFALEGDTWTSRNGQARKDREGETKVGPEYRQGQLANKRCMWGEIVRTRGGTQGTRRARRMGRGGCKPRILRLAGSRRAVIGTSLRSDAGERSCLEVSILASLHVSRGLRPRPVVVSHRVVRACHPERPTLAEPAPRCAGHSRRCVGQRYCVVPRLRECAARR